LLYYLFIVLWQLDALADTIYCWYAIIQYAAYISILLVYSSLGQNTAAGTAWVHASVCSTNSLSNRQHARVNIRNSTLCMAGSLLFLTWRYRRISILDPVPAQDADLHMTQEDACSNDYSMIG
jgi:hypothetical protein